MIKLINAHDKNGVIGYQNKMPWHVKEELAFFKKETLNHYLLMGRNTFVGIGKVLPNRTTYVLTRDHSFSVADENVIVVHDALALIEDFKNSDKILFIAGGQTVYNQFYPHATELIISIIDGEYEGDAYFTNINYNDYQKINTEVHEKFIVNRYCKNLM